MIKHRPGYDGWIALAALVLVAEASDTRTLSDTWRSAPLRYTVPIAVVTNAHLFGLLPGVLDPFVWASKIPVPRRTRVR